MYVVVHIIGWLHFGLHEGFFFGGCKRVLTAAWRGFWSCVKNEKEGRT